MRILLLDNLDSFTYNLSHYVEMISGIVPIVVRGDEFDKSQLHNIDGVILSPGPGLPSEHRSMALLLNYLPNATPLLGICLGMQAIAEKYGCKLKNMKTVRHGVETKVFKNEIEDPILAGLPDEFIAGSYHSWVVDRMGFSESLQITSTDFENEIVSLKHKVLPQFGVQIHPESVMTPHGKQIIENWINVVRNKN